MAHLIGQTLLAAILFVVGMFVYSNRIDAGQAAVSGVQYRASKKAMLGLAAVLEQDLRNLGSNFPDYYDLEPDEAVMAWDTVSSIRYIEFTAQTQPLAQPDTVRYEWQVVDSTEIDGHVKPVFRLTRFVNGQEAGSMPAALTRVSVDVGRPDGSPVTSLADARLVAVELSGFGSLGSDRMIKVTRWTGIYRPVAVTRNDFDDF